jgi:plasmid segregation protein ParM
MHTFQPTQFPRPIARAIDLGSGFVKFTTDCPDQNTINCDLFPSVAVECDGGVDVDGDGASIKRDLIRVVVNGKAYSVGKDVKSKRTKGRVRGTDYSETDEYLALTYGAFAYMLKKMGVHEARIDVLVVGLPISTLAKYKDTLAKKMVGEHIINDEMRVVVGECIVRSQPRGGYDFIRATTGQEDEQLKRDMDSGAVLVVDPGYYTLDWLYAEEGKGDAQFSGAINDGGMSMILDRVAAELARDFGADEQAFLFEKDKIDHFLQTGEPFFYDGRYQDDVERYRNIARAQAGEYIQLMLERIKEKKGFIRKVIEVGGSNHIYGKLLKDVFGENRVFTSKDSVFTNVKGYQVAGNVRVKSLANAIQGLRVA